MKRSKSFYSYSSNSDTDSATEDHIGSMYPQAKMKKKSHFFPKGSCDPDVEILKVEPGSNSRQVEIIKVECPPKQPDDVEILRVIPGTSTSSSEYLARQTDGHRNVKVKVEGVIGKVPRSKFAVLYLIIFSHDFFWSVQVSYYMFYFVHFAALELDSHHKLDGSECNDQKMETDGN